MLAKSAITHFADTAAILNSIVSNSYYGMVRGQYCRAMMGRASDKKSGTGNKKLSNFGRDIPTGISGPPPEVIPNIPVRRNRNGPFHLISDRNFRNLWHNEKHPLFLLVVSLFLLVFSSRARSGSKR